MNWLRKLFRSRDYEIDKVAYDSHWEQLADTQRRQQDIIDELAMERDADRDEWSFDPDACRTQPRG